MNTYFGNDYVRHFFSWCQKNYHAIVSCNTDKTILFFVICDLWFHEFEMLKPTLNNLTILDSILTSEFIVINYCMF